MLTQRKRVIRIAGIVCLILLIPLVLTIRDGGVEGVGWNWKPGDFLVMGGLMFGTGLVIDFALRKFTNPIHKIAAIAAIVLAFLLVWVELAVDGITQMLELLR